MNSLSCKIKDVGITLDIRTHGDVEDGMRNRSYTIPTSLVSNIEGTYYITLSRQCSSTRRLMTMQST